MPTKLVGKSTRLAKAILSRRSFFGAAMASGFLASGPLAALSMHSKHWPLRADVDLRKQRMHLYEYGKKIYTWKISSGKKGFYTPQGVYSPKWMRKMHYSNTYDNAHMPHAIFFYKGYAVHGTEWTSKLGSEASKGCIRLLEPAAKEFYSLVEEHGMKKTRINITY